MKITLPIFHYTENNNNLIELGLYNATPESNELHDIIFYDIVAISQSRDNKNHTIIYANNDCFVCNLSIDVVDTLICKAKLIYG